MSGKNATSDTDAFKEAEKVHLKSSAFKEAEKEAYYGDARLTSAS